MNIEDIKIIYKVGLILFMSFCTNFTKAQNIDSVDVINYHLNVDFTNYKSKQIKGIAEIKLQPNKVSKVHKIKFLLLKLDVDSIFYKNQNDAEYKKVQFTYNDTLITLNQSLSTIAQVKIYYQGTPTKDASWGGIYFNGDYVFNLGVGFVSNPHNYGRVWFPCIDNFTDKAIYSYSITVPKGFAAICGGLLLDTIPNTNSTVWNWAHTYPIPTYLASFAMAPYKLVNDKFQGINRMIPITLAALGKDTTNLKNSFFNLKNAMKAFEQYYGPYRFERVGYSLVPFEGGAMEHACNIAYPVSGADGKLTKETLMAHELSHHWWGNNVTCATAEDMWLNEGWAVYSEALFIDFVYGKSAYQNYINSNHKYVLQFAHIIDGNATAVSGISHNNTYGTHVYKKGADMIHCIRGVMTENDFKLKCSSFMEKYKGANASTAEFSAHFEIPNQFVEQIIQDTGFCHFSIFKTESTKDNSNWKTKVNYIQRNRFGNHVYNSIPLEVHVFDNHLNKKVFKQNFSNNLSFEISTPFKPEFIAIDYDQKMSDAITDDVIVTDSAKKFKLDYGMMDIDITAISDTSLIRVEHNWVYPDAWFNKLPNVQISKERYWTVDGIFDPSLKVSATIWYDGNKSNFNSGWLDADLLNNRSEDSIVLLYRPNAESFWRIETNCVKAIGLKNDKKGSFKINQLMKGQYCFGVYAKTSASVIQVTNTNQISLFPNPSKGEINIKWSTNISPYLIELRNDMGQLVLEKQIEKGIHSVILPTNNLPKGNYYAIVIGLNNQTDTLKFSVN